MNYKKEIAQYCVKNYLKDGLSIGVGTGSTVNFFIESMSELFLSGNLKNINVYSSSMDTQLKLAQKGIEYKDILFLNNKLDYYFDGADEFDENNFLIKGGGGALLREKILAYHSNNFIVMVDSSKRVKKIGLAFKVPLEVVTWSYSYVAATLRSKNIDFELRMSKNKMGPEYTDNGNMILDLNLVNFDILKIHDELLTTPGVVEIGIFKGYKGRIITNDDNGLKFIEV